MNRKSYRENKNILSFNQIKDKYSYSEVNLLRRYIKVDKLPCLINAPYRKDAKPSLGISVKNNKIVFNDFAINKGGNLIDLLQLCWDTDYNGVLEKLNSDLEINPIAIQTPCYIKKSSSIDISIKIRNWAEYDLNYWNSYGVTKEVLKNSLVIPISHYSINNTLIKADKFAYSYIVMKNNDVKYKIYQPFSFKYKWINNYPPNTINNLHLIDRYKGSVIIASSLKDAMCIMSNYNTLAIAPQSEGANIPEDVIKLLKERFDKQYILLDNDKAGLEYGLKMSEKTGFKNLVIPQFEGGKDISDLYKVMGKEKFKEIFKKLK